MVLPRQDEARRQSDAWRHGEGKIARHHGELEVEAWYGWWDLDVIAVVVILALVFTTLGIGVTVTLRWWLWLTGGAWTCVAGLVGLHTSRDCYGSIRRVKGSI